MTDATVSWDVASGDCCVVDDVHMNRLLHRQPRVFQITDHFSPRIWAKSDSGVSKSGQSVWAWRRRPGQLHRGLRITVLLIAGTRSGSPCSRTATSLGPDVG